jgi:hypothetical protein
MVVVLLMLISFGAGYAWRGVVGPEARKGPLVATRRLRREIAGVLADGGEAQASAKALIESIGILFMVAARQSASLRARRIGRAEPR